MKILIMILGLTAGIVRTSHRGSDTFSKFDSNLNSEKFQKFLFSSQNCHFEGKNDN